MMDVINVSLVEMGVWGYKNGPRAFSPSPLLRVPHLSQECPHIFLQGREKVKGYSEGPAAQLWSAQGLPTTDSEWSCRDGATFICQ